MDIKKENKFYTTGKSQERVVLVGLVIKPAPKEDADAHLDELALLTETAGALPVERFIQRLPHPDRATFIGKGMLEEIATYVQENSIDTVIFDDELSPSQLRNIEKKLKCKILDRTNLILDIFAGRARTAHARIQVELAQCNYLLPRLAGMWTHLEKQRGGIGLRGPGETEIETDRRVIRDKIARLKKELLRIDKQKSTQRMNRGKLVRVALVGYTNAGKSTLLNLLSKSQVLAEDKLFATLDTTVRKVVIHNLPFLLADTVGFIHKLPHFLVESFKATLDEVRESDLLVHVIDVSHPDYAKQMEVVQKTLDDLGVGEKPVLTVFNKIDVVPPPPPPPAPGADSPGTEEDQPAVADAAGTGAAGEAGTPEGGDEQTVASVIAAPVKPPQKQENTIYISAKKKTNIDLLREKIYEIAKTIHITRYPYHDFLY